MRINLFLLFLFFIAQGASVFAQDEKLSCAQPYSFLFEDFPVGSSQDTKVRLAAFAERLGHEDPQEAVGHIYVYAGLKTKVGEAEKIVAEINNLLPKEIGNRRVYVTDRGYKSVATVEMFIRPLECSYYPSSNSEYGAEDIELEEAPSESTPVKTPDELIEAIRENPQPICPPAVRAIGRCTGEVVVRVLIDEKGGVIFARSLAGFVLLRNAGTAAAGKWKFKPFLQNGKPTKVFGNVTVQFKEPTDLEIDY
jgi:hypothetical protein